MLTYIFITISVIIFFLMTKRDRSLPPGPRKYPFIGMVEKIDLRNAKLTYRKLRKIYGDVFCLQLKSSTIIIVNGREALNEIFIKHGDVTSDRPVSFLTTITKGLGIGGSSGQLWKEHRTFALSTLRRFGRKGIEAHILGEIETFLSFIESSRANPLDIKDVVTISVSNVICGLVFGKRFDHNDKQFQRMMELVALVIDFPLRGILPGDTAALIEVKSTIVEISKFIYHQIQEHRDTLDENDLRDYIDTYLVEQKKQQNDKQSTFSDEQLVASIRSLFIAGTETTATTILWTVLFLMHHPEVQAKMIKELQEVLGLQNQLSLQYKHQLPYCEAVVLEGQRLSNVSWVSLPHLATEDLAYKQYTIPKGATLFACLDSLAFDPKIFPNPEKFVPDRFLDSSGNLMGKDNFFPFSLGKRVCIGDSLAKMELFLFIVSMVHRFDLRLVDTTSTIADEKEMFKPRPYTLKAVKRS